MKFKSNGEGNVKNILLIDDDPDITDLIEHLIGGYYKLTIEHDPSSALRTVMFEKPDLILLDINMPNINGLVALKQLKAQFRNKEFQPKIVMLTSNNTLETVKKAIADGADSYIIKPFDPTVFVNRIHDLLYRFK